MFDSLLRPAAVTRRRYGTGAAFAIALHAWILVAALGQARQASGTEKGPPPTLDLVLASAPPKLGGSGPTPAAPQKAARKAPNPQVYHPQSPETRPAETRPADSPPPTDDAAAKGDGATTGGGGDCVGNCTGTGSGVANGDPEGVIGGTGTARPSAPPPPTYLQLNIGDPLLDQSTCQVYGTPPYPREALAAKVEGVVLARCTVEPDGSLSGCAVLKSPYSFDAPVKAWLSSAKARPFTSSGRPVRVPCNFKFNYKVE